jgi:hypothetical protein
LSKLPKEKYLEEACTLIPYKPNNVGSNFSACVLDIITHESNANWVAGVFLKKKYEHCKSNFSYTLEIRNFLLLNLKKLQLQVEYKYRCEP